VLNARRAARELALFCLLQPERCQPNGLIAAADIPLVMHSVVRLMVDEAKDAIETAAIDLQQAYATIQDVEWDHPDNTHSGLEAPVVPVHLPKTDAMRLLLEKCLKAADLLNHSLTMPLRRVHMENPDVVQHAHTLIHLVQAHRAEIDGRLNACMDEWRMDRVFRLDGCIMRVALAEMLYVNAVDVGVSINEAVELAKQYSSEDSYKLINGVLGKAAQRLDQPYEAPVAPVAATPVTEEPEWAV
jgi:transcription antitermination factor NusB